MSEWKEFRFSDFVLINPKVTLPKGELIPFVEMKDLVDGRRFCTSEQERELSGGSRFADGDTLFARITPCLENGKICQVQGLKGGVGLGSTEFYVFRAKPGVSHADFVYYLSRWQEVRDHAEINLDGTSGRQRVPKEAFNDLLVTLPPLPEQRAIAAILSSLDDKIDLLHRQNATLEKMAETLFRQWFVEEVREEWETGKVSDLIKILSGFAFKSSIFVESGKYRLVTIKGVQDGYLELNNADSIEELPSRMPDFCKLQIGDILLSLTGNVGRCCLVDTSDLVLNQRVAKLHPVNERDRAYTYFLFRQPQIKLLLEEMGKGTAQSNLSPIETASMELLIPDEERLNLFSDQATPWLKKMILNKKAIQKLAALRDSLLPKLMSGEVRIEEIES